MGNAYYQDQSSAAFWGDAKNKQPNSGRKNVNDGIKVKTDATFKQVEQSELPPVGGKGK